MAANATFALNAGVWFRRARLLIVSPDSLGTACPRSGRNSTYRPVQISEASSTVAARQFEHGAEIRHTGTSNNVRFRTALLIYRAFAAAP